MDPCNGMPFLVMTQTGAENISDTMCRPYCGQAVRCSLYNKDRRTNQLQEYNKTTSVEVECHCWSSEGCNGVFLQISLTSLVNQKVPGKLCEIDLYTNLSNLRRVPRTLSPILIWLYCVYNADVFIQHHQWHVMRSYTIARIFLFNRRRMILFEQSYNLYTLNTLYICLIPTLLSFGYTCQNERYIEWLTNISTILGNWITNRTGKWLGLGIPILGHPIV